MASVEELVLNIHHPHLRENALLLLATFISNHGELYPNLAPWLWNSFGTIDVLLQEIISVYRVLSPPNLTTAQSSRVGNAVTILQCLAAHQDIRMMLLNAQIHQYLYPFLYATCDSEPFAKLRFMSLEVIAALVQDSNTNIICFLLSSEIIPLCLLCMEIGNEFSKTIAALTLHKILVNDVGLEYICTTPERLNGVIKALETIVVVLVEHPFPELLKNIMMCYLRLCDDPRACGSLQWCLPHMPLRYATLRCCGADVKPSNTELFEILLLKVNGPP